MNGFLALARRYGVPLAGGDTSESPAIARGRDGLIAADIVAVGQTPRNQALLRSGARPGDSIYVTGELGGAAAELKALEKSPGKFAKLTRAVDGHPHLYPEPRLAVGRRLRKLAHAAIDISDGLSTDLTHLCQESRVAATIDEAALPIRPLAAESRDPLGLALERRRGLRAALYRACLRPHSTHHRRRAHSSHRNIAQAQPRSAGDPSEDARRPVHRSRFWRMGAFPAGERPRSASNARSGAPGFQSVHFV